MQPLVTRLLDRIEPQLNDVGTTGLHIHQDVDEVRDVEYPDVVVRPARRINFVACGASRLIEVAGLQGTRAPFRSPHET